jgi:FG-GAP-like repeat
MDSGVVMTYVDIIRLWQQWLWWLASLCLVVGGMSVVSAAPPLPPFAKALTLGPAAEWRFGPLVLDVTRDGVPDLVATARLLDPALHLWRGDGQAFTPVPATWTDSGYGAVASADINQDGWPDLVSASHFGKIQTLRSDGQGGFTEVSMACDDGAVAVHLAELTGDGQVDLVRVGFQTAGLEVYAGDGHGHWTRHTRLPEPRPGSVAKTDWSVRRGWMSSRYAANPNSWLITRFWARTSPLAIPSSWPLRIMCMAS